MTPQIPHQRERDEATLGVSGAPKDDSKGFAEEDKPSYHPPETLPEPRPPAPVMNPTSHNSNQRTNTNSPA